MNRDHAVIEELLAVRALGGLDGDDLQLLERELASHGDCEECRRLEAAYEETAGLLAFALDPAPVSTPAADVIAARPARGRPWRVLATVAAALVLVIVAVAVLGPRTIGVHPSTQQTVVHFTGSAGELAMAYVPGQPGAILLGTGFDDPGPDKVYEVWMITGQTPTSGGCVRPHDGEIATAVHGDVNGADLMAVTVEPASCPSQPTSQPVLTAPLTA
jgi:anti-sigma-K factor RskA